MLRLVTRNALLNYYLYSYFIAFICVLISIVFNFFDSSYARMAFYWSFYFSVICLVIKRNRLGKDFFWVLTAISLLGISKLGWFYCEYLGNPDYSQYNPYLNTGKRLLISAVIGWTLLSSTPLTINFYDKIKKLVFYFTMCAFVIASGVGLWQICSHVERVDFLTGRATDGAYMYSGLSLVTIALLSQYINHWFSLLLSLLTFILSYFIIVETDTRNMLIAFPVIFIAAILISINNLNLKWVLGILLSCFILVFFNYQSKIEPRLEQAVSDTEEFLAQDGNNEGSFSSRLAMWTVGAKSFALSPMGRSMEARETWMRNYIDSSGKYHAGWNYLNIHLHNEVMDTATLQGVLGVLVLLFFYGVIIGHAITMKNTLMFFIGAVIIISGLTDVIFISREQTIFFMSLIIVSMMWSRSEKKEG